MPEVLNSAARSRWYWLMLVALGLFLEATALFYQYRLDYYPCVLCIHVRIWVLGFTLLALLALFVRRSMPLLVLAHGLNTVMMAGLFERSWKLLGIERGTLEGTCDFNSGLPPWFALDHWFPAVFEVLESCGYTPELLFGITMAESLVVLSAVLVTMSAVLTLAAVRA